MRVLTFNHIYTKFSVTFVYMWIFQGHPGISSQHEITIATFYYLFCLIKLTNFLNAHEGSVKDSVVGEEYCTILAGSFKY